ncbi:RNA polymerase sigma-70 factor (plasmid) [Pedobacter sp. BS3]|uniref:RNA polymerase sigma-70 factor n=1 Tax=Pedobacter sp. BS3 TaxID=2567937 RepID=UPI0011EC84F9|nr:RNA polymerase sigma-70 factor [Pedobacter sp. BS3]TZF85569.1 RNA polymerase sigma-70 factor [Pedobacter sp. BS3]
MTEYKHISDHELLVKLGNDDKRAFDEIYRRYWNGMFSSAYNMLRDREACMDILQEIFIWLWEHRYGVTVDSLQSYLLSAVKFKVANYIRNGKVRASFFDRLKEAEAPGELATDNVEVKELSAIIAHYANQLPDKCREIFLLSRHEYLTNKEIASRLGISVKTVENQMTIAIRKLKTSIAKISSFLFFL